MTGRFIGRRTPMSFDVAEAQRMEAARQTRIRKRALQVQPQQPQVQQQVRRVPEPLQLAPQSRFVDPESFTQSVTGRGSQGLDTSTVNLQRMYREPEFAFRGAPVSQETATRLWNRLSANGQGLQTADINQMGLGNLIPEYRVAARQQYIQAAANAPLKQGNSFKFEARPEQSADSPYFEGKYIRSNNRNALEATTQQYNDLLADGAIESFQPAPLSDKLYQGLLADKVIQPFNRTVLTNEDNYLKGIAMNASQQMVPLNRPPSLPRGETGIFKNMPAAEMEYGRIQELPDGMKQQGSFYTPEMLGIGTTKPIGIEDTLTAYEQAMDEFKTNGNFRFMEGNNYNGFQPVDPADKKGWNESAPFPTTPEQWVDSYDPIATARFTKSEREYTPLISVNSQGKSAPVPQSDEPTSMVIPAWQNGNLTPEYSQPIPQRLVDAINKNAISKNGINQSMMVARPSVDITEQIISEGVPLERAQRIPESTPLRGNPLTLKEQLGLGASPIGSREIVTGTVPSAFSTPTDDMGNAIETAMAQQQMKGGYAMTTLPDENSMRLDKNYEANPQLMLPSTVIADTVLSPYKLTYGSEMKTGLGSDGLGGRQGVLTAASSSKARAGDDERLEWMLRSGKIPNESGEYTETTPGYVKYTPATNTVEHDNYTETMTDSQNVRDRITAQAKKMNIQASISAGERQRFQSELPLDSARSRISPNLFSSEQEADAWLRARNGDIGEIPVNDRFRELANSAGMTVDGKFYDNTGFGVDGQFYNSAKMFTPRMLETLHHSERRAAIAQGNAFEMNRRKEFTENAIADAHAVALKDGGDDSQNVRITMVRPDGTMTEATRELTPQEQVETGRNALAQGYGRLISSLPPNTIAEPRGFDVFEVQNKENEQKKARQYYLKNTVGQIRPRQSTPYPIQLEQGQVAEGVDPSTGLLRNTGIQLRSY